MKIIDTATGENHLVDILPVEIDDFKNLSGYSGSICASVFGVIVPLISV